MTICECKRLLTTVGLRNKMSRMAEVSKTSVTLFQCSICYEVFKSIEDLLIHDSQHVQVKGHKLAEVTTEPENEFVYMNDIEVACDVEVGTDDSCTVYFEESPAVPEQNPEELTDELPDKATEASDDDSSVTESDLSDSMVDEPAWNDFELNLNSSSQKKNRGLHEDAKDTPASLMMDQKSMKNSELLKYIEADHGLPAGRQASQLEELIKSEYPLKSQDLNCSSREKNGSNLNNICNKCERRFWNANALMKHTCEIGERPYNTRRKSSPIKLKVKLTHNPRPYSCSVCDKRFSNTVTLKKHELAHAKPMTKADARQKKTHKRSELKNPKLNQVYTCNICNKAFKTEILFDTHALSHGSQTSENEHACDLCDKVFSTAQYLKKHLLRHATEKQFKCDECGKAFKVKSDLHSHAKTHTESYSKSRTSSDNFCEMCGKLFSTRSNLLKHYVIHSNNRDFKCEQCPKTYKAKGELTRHIKSKHKNLKYKCSQCSRQFTSSYYARLHERSHTGADLIYCEICDKQFFVHATYERHRITHTGEKPFECKICGKCVTSNSSLQSHILIHKDQKPHKCNVCDKSFMSRIHLNDHKTIHTGSKTHKCGYCNKAFYHQRSLRRHCKKKHLENSANITMNNVTQKEESSDEDSEIEEETEEELSSDCD